MGRVEVSHKETLHLADDLAGDLLSVSVVVGCDGQGSGHGSAVNHVFIKGIVVVRSGMMGLQDADTVGAQQIGRG